MKYAHFKYLIYKYDTENIVAIRIFWRDTLKLFITGQISFQEVTIDVSGKSSPSLATIDNYLATTHWSPASRKEFFDHILQRMERR